MNMNGEKVNLRPIKMSDTEMLCKWKNSEQTYMYLGGGYQPISEDQYRKWVENMIDQTGRSRRFIVETKNNKPIGMVGLYEINWIHRTCEIGAFIGAAEEQGNGYAREACFVLEEYAQNYLNLRKISLKVVDDNERAKLFWTKQGYYVVGVQKRERYINGKYCDVVIMEKFIDCSENSGGGTTNKQ